LLGLALMLSPWSSTPSLGGGLFGLASAVFLASNVLLSKRLTRDLSGAELLFFRSLFALPAWPRCTSVWGPTRRFSWSRRRR
jgi:drug/metabolite transporter (DMT)-like permease